MDSHPAQALNKMAELQTELRKKESLEGSTGEASPQLLTGEGSFSVADTKEGIDAMLQQYLLFAEIP